MEDCQYHSIKFDPFMYLSLPLPDRRTRSFEVTVVHVDGSKAPTRYTVAAPITGGFFRHPPGPLFTGQAWQHKLEYILVQQLQQRAKHFDRRPQTQCLG